MQSLRLSLYQFTWALAFLVSTSALFLSPVIPAVAQSSACNALSTPLRPGAVDQSVSALQRCLTEQGAYSGAITTTYGPRTVAAVQQFQAARGIVSSGSPATTGYGAVGSRTLNALRSGATTVPQPVLDMLGVTVNPDAAIGWKTLIEARATAVSSAQNATKERAEMSATLSMLHNADATARGVFQATGSDGSEDISLEVQFIVPDDKRGYVALGKQTSGGLLDGLKLRRFVNRWFSFDLPEAVAASVGTEETSLAQQFADAQRAHPTFAFTEQGSNETVVSYAFTINPETFPAFLAAFEGSEEPAADLDAATVDYIRGTIAITRATTELERLTVEGRITDDDGMVATFSLATNTERLSAPALIRRPARSNPIEDLFEGLLEGMFLSSRESSWELP